MIMVMMIITEKKKQIAQRHQMVSDYLAMLLFIGLDLLLGSRAAAPMEGLSPVEWGEIPCVCMSICPFIRPSVRRLSSWLDLRSG